MKITGECDMKAVCFMNNQIGKFKLDGVKRTMDFTFLESIPFDYSVLKKQVREEKHKVISLKVGNHNPRLSKEYLSKFLNSYNRKTADIVKVSVLSNISPVLFEIGEDKFVLAPIIKNE